MTNFDFLKQDMQFTSFADVAITAEKILHMDIDSCVINCRRAMEFAVKWLYAVDSTLVMPPYQENLRGLMNDSDFRDLVGADIWQRMDLIRKVGNNSAHGGKKVTMDEAKLCLENLFIFLDFIAYCYGSNYEEHHYKKNRIKEAPIREAFLKEHGYYGENK